MKNRKIEKNRKNAKIEKKYLLPKNEKIQKCFRKIQLKEG